MDLTADYDYDLPAERIAQHPLADRTQSRLLVMDRNTGDLADRQFQDLPDLLTPGDLLVMNDTRVTARRLRGRKATGGAVEALVLGESSPGVYRALMRPGRSLRVGSQVKFEDGLNGTICAIEAEGIRLLKFDPAGGQDWLAQAGDIPLPPYVTTKLSDENRYQTTYAREPGSAAAPTAGLHFTPELLGRIRGRGIGLATVTLDVSLDTFRPVTEARLADHAMHGERCAIPEVTAQAIAECRGRVIAVGTTTVRTLESFAIGRRRVRAGEQTTTMFIRPGYEFKIVDALITNFHMPRTTLMALVSAFAGRDAVMHAYRHAVLAEYRFLSFGDAMLIA